MNISTQRISCPNVERKCYIFWQSPYEPERNKLIGELIEQENDAGENMFLFKFYYDTFEERDWEDITVSGIDLTRKEEIIVRSGREPYFITGRIPPRCREDLDVTFKRLQIDYYDPFEMILRSRAISQHDWCYTGRTPTDFFDRHYYRDIAPLELKKVIPNLPCGNYENDFHPIKVHTV